MNNFFIKKQCGGADKGAQVLWGKLWNVFFL